MSMSSIPSLDPSDMTTGTTVTEVEHPGTTTPALEHLTGQRQDVSRFTAVRPTNPDDRSLEEPPA